MVGGEMAERWAERGSCRAGAPRKDQGRSSGPVNQDWRVPSRPPPLNYEAPAVHPAGASEPAASSQGVQLAPLTCAHGPMHTYICVHTRVHRHAHTCARTFSLEGSPPGDPTFLEQQYSCPRSVSWPHGPVVGGRNFGATVAAGSCTRPLSSWTVTHGPLWVPPWPCEEAACRLACVDTPRAAHISFSGRAQVGAQGLATSTPAANHWATAQGPKLGVCAPTWPAPSPEQALSSRMWGRPGMILLQQPSAQTHPARPPTLRLSLLQPPWCVGMSACGSHIYRLREGLELAPALWCAAHPHISLPSWPPASCSHSGCSLLVLLS